jgi:peptidoglycan/xylan/chitin deacetylase (PgdA/CDA1 family)
VFRVALTFDAEHPDRPTRSGIQEELLQALDREGVRATFFIQGRWAEAYPDTAQKVARAGHLIGSHSFYHARMPLFSDEGLATDVKSAEDVIRQVLGVDPRPWFRCPFGAGSDDPRVLRALEQLGYRDVGWNVSPDDWDVASTDASVEERVVQGTVEQGDAAVVLMHTWPRPTLAALPGIVARLRDAGAEFATIDAVPLPVPSRPE